MSKKQYKRLPTSKPDSPYTGVIVAVKEHVGKTRQAFGWQPVIRVELPVEFTDLLCIDAILIDALDPNTTIAAAAKCVSYGLTVGDLWDGSVPDLLEGRRVEFDYRAAKPPTRLLPEVKIRKVLATVGH